MTRRRIVLIALILIAAFAVIVALTLDLPGGPVPGGLRSRLPILGGRSPLVPPAPPPAETGVPVPRGRLREVVAKDLLAPTVSRDGRQLYYLERETGHLLASALDGTNEQTLSNLTILETFAGYWSPGREKVVLAYQEGPAVKTFALPVASGTPSHFLPLETTSFSWSPDGRSMAYLIRRGTESALIIADQANRGSRTVYTTPIPDFEVRWASANSILLVSRPSGLAPSLVLRFDPLARRAGPIIGGRRGVILLPAPDGSGFVFSSSGNRAEALPLAFASLRGSGADGLDAITIAEKCAFSANAKTLYCAVPAGGFAAPSPDLWYRGAGTLSDRIFAIDLATKSATLVPEGELGFEAISLVAAPDGQYLFFQDRATGHLWRLEIGEGE